MSIVGKLATDDRWFSINNIADHLGVTRDSICRWIERRKLPAHRLGKLWELKKSEVDDRVMGGGAADSRPPIRASAPRKR